MYKVEITGIYGAQVTLNAKDRIRLKDTTAHKRLDDLVTENSEVVIVPSYVAELKIHNDENKLGDPDYVKYVLVDKDDNTYTTSSRIWFDSFINIDSEMRSEYPDGYELVTYQGKSVNGNGFLTCTVK